MLPSASKHSASPDHHGARANLKVTRNEVTGNHFESCETLSHGAHTREEANCNVRTRAGLASVHKYRIISRPDSIT